MAKQFSCELLGRFTITGAKGRFCQSRPIPGVVDECPHVGTKIFEEDLPLEERTLVCMIWKDVLVPGGLGRWLRCPRCIQAEQAAKEDPRV